MDLGARHAGEHLQWSGEVELGHLRKQQDTDLERHGEDLLKKRLDDAIMA
jgi:hypothetical protein